MTTTCDLNVDWNKCPNCARFKERIEDAEEASRAASATLDRAYTEYREDVAAGRACIATPRQRAWNSYLDDLEMEQSLASTRCTEAINAWATSIHRHHRLHEDRQQKAEGGKGVAADTDDAMSCSCAMCQAEDGEPAETEEMHTVATDSGDASASAHGDLDGDGEPLYLCGGFLNVQAERHATVERHEIEEDDVLRDAVRAIEHGETSQIRAWGFGNRQGRRTALRELRELLDDMIASIDDDNQQSQQTTAVGTPPQEPAETEDKSDATECDDHERGDLTLEGAAALVNSRLSEYEDGGKR